MKRKILRNFIYVIVIAVTASTVLLIWLSQRPGRGEEETHD